MCSGGDGCVSIVRSSMGNSGDTLLGAHTSLVYLYLGVVQFSNSTPRVRINIAIDCVRAIHVLHVQQYNSTISRHYEMERVPLRTGAEGAFPECSYAVTLERVEVSLSSLRYVRGV